MKEKSIIKTLLLFLLFLGYSQVSMFVSKFIGCNFILVSFVFDIIFLIFVVFSFKENIKKDLKEISKYKISKLFKTSIFWVIVIFSSNLLMGFVTESICPNLALDDNTIAITSLFEISTYYTIFKTMIFAIIAEELLFRKSIGDIINNDVLFILISSLIYTFVTFVFNGFPTSNIFLYFMIYFIPEVVLSIAYIKNERNIVSLMIIKFIYQLIPLVLLLFL